MKPATQVRRPPVRPYARSLSPSQIGWTLLQRSEGGPPVRPYARSLSPSQIGWTLLHRSEGHQSDRMQGACHRVRLNGRCYTSQKASSQTVCKELVTESDWMDAATKVRRPPVRPYARSLSPSQIGWTLLHRSEGHQSDRMQGACQEVRLDGLTGQRARQNGHTTRQCSSN
jgi:hypothetical protein